MSATLTLPRVEASPAAQARGLLQRARGLLQKWPGGFRGYRVDGSSSGKLTQLL